MSITGSAPKPRTLDEIVEHIIELLELCRFDPLKDTKATRHHNFDLTAFSPIEPFREEWFSLMSAARGERIEQGYFFNATPRDVDGQWDVSVVTDHRDDAEPDDKERPGWLTLIRFRSLNLRDLRGFKVCSPYVGEFRLGFVFRDLTYRTGHAYYEWVGRWRMLQQGLWTVNPGELFSEAPEDQDTLRMAMGVAFTRYFDWSVALGRPGGLKLLLPTDAVGCREIFRLRDIPEGAERRAALRHWVREHWRRRRISDTDARKVREHLRGATHFDWKGLECDINISRYDLNRDLILEERARQEAKQTIAWAEAHGFSKAAIEAMKAKAR